MCDIKKGFKLCTCGKIKASEADWTLRRIRKDIFIVGEVIPYMLSEEETSVHMILTEELDDRNCFDFTYKPVENDEVKIRIADQEDNWYVFKYQSGRWVDQIFPEIGNRLYKKGKIKES